MVFKNKTESAELSSKLNCFSELVKTVRSIEEVFFTLFPLSPENEGDLLLSVIVCLEVDISCEVKKGLLLPSKSNGMGIIESNSP